MPYLVYDPQSKTILGTVEEDGSVTGGETPAAAERLRQRLAQEDWLMVNPPELTRGTGLESPEHLAAKMFTLSQEFKIRYFERKGRS